MVADQHYKRLERMYASTSAGAHEKGMVAVSYGRSQVNASIEGGEYGAAGPSTRTSYHQLLSDAASLAAGSLEKEHVVNTEQFSMQVDDPDYQGPVVATAQVVMVQPPHYIVRAALVTPEGDVVAQAEGVFTPGDTELPAAPELSDDLDAVVADEHPAPALFMPVFPTKMGPLCLN